MQCVILWIIINKDKQQCCLQVTSYSSIILTKNDHCDSNHIQSVEDIQDEYALMQVWVGYPLNLDNEVLEEYAFILATANSLS